MNWFLLVAYTYLCALCWAAAGGVYHWGRSSLTLRLITVLLCISATTEVLSILLKKFDYDTEIHHHLLSLAEIFITISCYLSLRKMLSRGTAIVVFLITVGLVGVSARYIQPLGTINSYMLVFEGVMCTFLSIHALYLLMISDELRILSDPQFWFWTLVLVSGTVSVLYWGLYLVTANKYQDVFDKMALGHAVINLLLYTPLAYAMTMIPKRGFKY